MAGWLPKDELESEDTVPPKPGTAISVRSIDYGYLPGSSEPAVYLSLRRSEKEAFFAFKKNYHKGQIIWVVMRRILDDPLGRRPVFVVREKTIGLEIPMSSGDFCGYTHFHPYFGLRFAVGDEFEVKIEEINEKTGQVYLSRFPFLLREYNQVKKEDDGMVVTVQVLRVDELGAYLELRGTGAPYIGFARRALWPNGRILRKGDNIPARVRLRERKINFKRIEEIIQQSGELPPELDLGIDLDVRIPVAFKRFSDRYHGHPRGTILTEVKIDRPLDNGGLLLDLEDGLRGSVYPDELDVDDQGRLKSAREYKPGQIIPTVIITRDIPQRAKIECSLLRVDPLPEDLPEVVRAKVISIRPDNRPSVNKKYITCLYGHHCRIKIEEEADRLPFTVGDWIDVQITKTYAETRDVSGQWVKS